MRSNILDYLNSQTFTNFSTSSELPWDASGVPLYLKNMKKMYVDRPQTVQEPLIDTLDDNGIVNETISVTVYVSADAKTLPTDYETMLSTVKAARLQDLTTGWRQRATSVATSFEGDILVTEFTFNFTKLI
jgi:hypothetical protein